MFLVGNFNPRSREGSDPAIFDQMTDFIHFNPRSRKGSDGTPVGKEDRNSISIHAPAKEATTL